MGVCPGSSRATSAEGLWTKRQMTKGPATCGRALIEAGGAEGNRTPDLYNAIVALSQLSYGPGKPAFRGPDIRSGRKHWQGTNARPASLVPSGFLLFLVHVIQAQA